MAAALFEEGDEVLVHVVVVIGDVEDGDALAFENVLEFAIEAAAVDGLHDENNVCPLDLFLGEGDVGALIESSGVRFYSWVICKDSLSSGASEFVLRAEEEEAFHGAAGDELRGG